MRRCLGLPERHHIGPATAQMRPGIDRIQLDRDFRKLKGGSCLAEIAEYAWVNKMLDVVHLHESAVARRERGIFADGIAEDGDRALPAFRIVFVMQTLPAQPAIVNIE